jgi:O-methyltransferase
MCFFNKGIFPTTAKPVEGKIFSFVHLDVSTYKSTLSCLEFFYPRMSTGGIILSHDYLNAFGVTKAFDEFFEERPKPVISLTGRQGLIMKLSDCEISY